MAKNQDLTLNFSKLNGVCGQLKCCLQYEDDVYREKRARLPKEGDFISTHTGEIGRVDRLHLLSEQFVMMTNKGIRKRFVVDLYKETLDKETANFPKEFESVSDETHKVIGMDETAAKKVKAFEIEVKTYKEKGKSFADGIFESLFGEKTFDYSLPDVKELASDKPRVKTPDEEEEIFYKATDEDSLDDDEDAVNYNEPVRTRFEAGGDRDHRDSRPQGRTQGQQQQRDNRPPQGNRDNQNRGPRPDNRNQNQGPRPEGQRPQGANPNQNPNQNRPQGNQGPRPQGGGQPNQGRNRPPR